MVIKFCLSLASKSSSTYSDLRYDSKTGSGILVLPSLRTLRDYKNYINPRRGFNPDIINDLSVKTKEFSPAERFVTILFDEMKIQEDLVWENHTGELIGLPQMSLYSSSKVLSILFLSVWQHLLPPVQHLIKSSPSSGKQ